MSIDRSLKTKGKLARHRNVLKRPERISQLQEEGKWDEGDPLLGLPKVAHRKSKAGKKKAEKGPEATAATVAAPEPQPQEKTKEKKK